MLGVRVAKMLSLHLEMSIRVLGWSERFQILRAIVEGVTIFVMNVPPVRNGTDLRFMYLDM